MFVLTQTNALVNLGAVALVDRACMDENCERVEVYALLFTGNRVQLGVFDEEAASQVVRDITDRIESGETGVLKLND